MIMPMRKVLLVDDDFLVRQFLRRLIDWEAEGLALCADAANGLEALQAMQEFQPDILITDIGMPVMDGITLIREIRQRGLQAKILVLSCHDEFEYVRQAMKLGANEYVLKHMLTEDGLRELLRAFQDGVVREEAARQMQTNLHTLAVKGLGALKKEFIQVLLEGRQQDQSQLLSAYGIQRKFRSAAAMIMRRPGGALHQVDASACREAASDYAVEVISCESDLYVLIDLSETVSAAAHNELLTGLIRVFQRAVSTQTGDRLHIGVSDVRMGADCLFAALTQAKQAILSSFYGQEVAYYHEAKCFATQLPKAAARLEHLFLNASVEQHTKEILMKTALHDIEQEQTDPMLVRRWVARLDAQCTRAPALPPVRFFSDCTKRLIAYQETWRALLKMPLLQTTHAKVDAAAAFIRLHYHEPISLADVAEEVGLNSAYLSYLFKHEAGVNFSEYLNQCRMHRVKHFLTASDMPIKDAAVASGFFDYQHFCKQFRQLTGMRPNEFRLQSKNITRI